MTSATRNTRRSELELYFDRTAVEAWKRLTSDAPVSGIRAQVRAGRDAMRETLLSWLPQDMRGLRLLDAGCGTGALAVEAARRGADVLAIDISPSLVDMARERTPKDLGAGSITFAVGDMLDPALGTFDHVVAMDSLIHYVGEDIAQTLASLAQRTRGSMVFTVAPRTPALTLLWFVGRMFPRSDRAPAIEPIAQSALERHMGELPQLNGWTIHRSQRVSRSFYISQALEVKRS
jgi:magnesium-protoporphyrin O-methyltransferase